MPAGHGRRSGHRRATTSRRSCRGRRRRAAASARAEIVLRTLVGHARDRVDTGDDFSLLLEDGDRVPICADPRRDRRARVRRRRRGAAAARSTPRRSTVPRARSPRSRATSARRSRALIDGGPARHGGRRPGGADPHAAARSSPRSAATLNSRDDELIGHHRRPRRRARQPAARRAELQPPVPRDRRRTGARDRRPRRATRARELDAILDERPRRPAIVDRHQIDLAEALAYAGDAIQGFASIALRRARRRSTGATSS